MFFVMYLLLKKNISYKNVHSNVYLFYNCPHCEIVIGNFGLLFGPVGTFSIFLIISKPSSTRPNTTCLLSRKLHFAHVTKNWQPFVSLPLFAIDSSPGESCLRTKFSSGNEPPYTLFTPVPSPCQIQNTKHELIESINLCHSRFWGSLILTLTKSPP